MVGTCFFDLSWASGTVAAPPFAFHCQAPAGLFVNSHSLLNRLSKKWLLHLVGVCDQVTSGPPVMASAPYSSWYAPALPSNEPPSACSLSVSATTATSARFAGSDDFMVQVPSSA